MPAGSFALGTSNLVFATGKYLSGLSLTGSYNLTAPGADFRMTNGASWTVECWVKTTQSTGVAILLGYAFGNTDWVLSIQSGVANFQANGFGAGTGGTPISGGGSIADNNWHHIRGVCDSGTSLHLYVDGTRVGTTTGTYATLGTEGSGQIGGWTGGTLRLTGVIDDVAIYNAALSTGASFTVPTTQVDNLAANLRVCYHCDPGNGFSGDLALLNDCAGISFTVSPTSGGNATSLTFTGSSTSWSTVPPAFTITGAGNSISTSVSGNTAATGTLTAGASGTQTIQDLSSSHTRTFTVSGGTTPPSAPTASVVTNSSGQDIVSYTASTAGTNPIAGYALYAGTTSGGQSPTPVATVTGAGAGSFSGQTSPTPGNSKFYIVRAYDNAGSPNYSADSNEVSTVGMSSGTLSTGTVTSSTVGLSWTSASNPAGTVSYQVQRAPDVAGSAGTYANVGSPQAGTTYTDTGLAPATKYFWRVVATDQATRTVTSNAATATTSSGPSLTMSGPSYGTTGVASTNFTVTASSAPGSNLTVTLSDSGGGGTFTPASATILSGQTIATFTYTPGSTGNKTISASASGYGSPSPLTYSSLPAGTYLLPVVAPYGTPYTGLAAALGFTVYSGTGTILLARTTGATYEMGSGTGDYVCNVPLDPSWSGVVKVDAPSGAAPYYREFQAPASAGGAPTASAIADAVLDELVADHSLAGSLGAVVATNTASLSTLLSGQSSAAATLAAINGNVNDIEAIVGISGVVVAPGAKTGYSLTQSFPSNFANLSIDGTGRVVLGPTGLDSISTAAPTGVAANFREMLVQVWRRYFKKTTMDASTIKTYGDNGTTVITNQPITDDGTTQTQGAAT